MVMSQIYALLVPGSSYATDSWKSYNGTYFYLGDDGAMLTDQLIDDGSNYYYVDANGAMVKNTWVMIAADEDEEQDVEYRWYYFGSSGKAYKSNDSFTMKTINGKKYGFDSEGKMVFGFVDESGDILNESTDDAILTATYYFGTNDDGARYSGWLRYEDGFSTTDEYDDDEYVWFWFRSNGKKLADNSRKKISGAYYAFDENGVMMTGFSDAITSDDATTYRYFSENIEDGSLQKNAWIYANGNPYDPDDEDDHWYRTNSSGTIITGVTKKINSKWYVFDSKGIMKNGLVLLNQNTVSGAEYVDNVDKKTDPEEITTAAKIYELPLDESQGLFYFSSSSSDGSMKTGTVKISLMDDDYTFLFDKTGAAHDGVKSSKVYRHGILQTADSDDKYDLVEDAAGNEYLVNASGKVMTTGVYKDGNEEYWVIITEGSGDTKGMVTKYWHGSADSSTDAKKKSGLYDD